MIILAKKKYRFIVGKDKKGKYLVFSKSFIKDYNVKAGQMINVSPVNSNRFVMKINKEIFLLKVK